ncbi:hypothetical protein [Aquimarina sp. 2201CG14-23]|uniref:hypothetical protein n=1 Tax=Aquimarina mycalae TaxID=3040073 RepID=UPI002478176E|nr:hypothetical protein [Aquimarina sp. 2201CG14-23]MDH7444264.1 hypothetical protein [Aquimarina sp. 2201CG14-23]
MYTRFLIILALLFSSCVTDDSFFPDENTDDIISSVSVVTILNNFDSNTTFLPEIEQCFKFVYPITLGYNNDATIRIDDYQGLVDVISSQETNFNVTGLQFPVRVIFKGSDDEVVIPNEIALFNVLRECEFDTVRDQFDRFFNGCFKFDYPVTLLSASGNEEEINSDEEFQIFYQGQGADYQPEFKFPVNVLVSPNFESTSINTYFGFFRIIESCIQRCPQLGFTFDVTDSFNLGYRFEADFPNLNVVGSYSWYVNGEFIEIDGPNNQGDNILLRDFDAPGVYEVCMKAETDNCPEGIEFCKRIEVAALCPELFFEFEQEQGTLEYTFVSNFTGISDVTYQWFVDEQAVEEDGGANGDNMFFSNLTPGVHTVCIKTTTPSCPNGVEFCREITVVPICPNLFFTVEQEGNTPSYNFTAQFDGIQDTTYEWRVNGDVIEQDGGPGADNTFSFQFSPGTYEICISAETPTCPDGTQFCEEIIVQ